MSVQPSLATIPEEGGPIPIPAVARGRNIDPSGSQGNPAPEVTRTHSEASSTSSATSPKSAGPLSPLWGRALIICFRLGLLVLCLLMIFMCTFGVVRMQEDPMQGFGIALTGFVSLVITCAMYCIVCRLYGYEKKLKRLKLIFVTSDDSPASAETLRQARRAQREERRARMAAEGTTRKGSETEGTPSSDGTSSSKEGTTETPVSSVSVVCLCGHHFQAPSNEAIVTCGQCGQALSIGEQVQCICGAINIVPPGTLSLHCGQCDIHIPVGQPPDPPSADVGATVDPPSADVGATVDPPSPDVGATVDPPSADLGATVVVAL